MISFDFSKPSDTDYRILCLGSHCDDIEIGCGGTILGLVESYPDAIFYWVIFSSSQKRDLEASNSAEYFLKNVKQKNIIIKDFRDGFFPFYGLEIKEYFEELKKEISPDLIFTHYRHDLHQDHRLISELTRNTFRNHLILEYEIPKYDGDIGNPNFYVHLDKSICHRKSMYILDSFSSQKHKHWFDEETFLGILRIRGMESCSPSKYAEAFYCHKVIISPQKGLC